MSPLMSPGLTILVPPPVLLVPPSPSRFSLYLSGIFRCVSTLLATSGILFSAFTTSTSVTSSYFTFAATYLSTPSLSFT
jgi:hypothetical protein